MEVAYAFQNIDEVPGEVPAGRTKPWGTGQAVLAAKAVVHEPFMVINADDYYGKEAFVKMHYIIPLRRNNGHCDRQISTSSGKIKFYDIANQEEMHQVLSNLLVDRQRKGTDTVSIKQEVPQSNADELKKYKELLDGGIISQEEFDAKKKQLLGI